MKDKLTKILERGIERGYEELRLEANDYSVAKALIGDRYSLRGLLLSKDFAKAYWGEEVTHCGSCGRHHESFADCDMGCGNNQETWEFHLQQAVISDNLIQYYEDNKT